MMWCWALMSSPLPLLFLVVIMVVEVMGRSIKKISRVSVCVCVPIHKYPSEHPNTTREHYPRISSASLLFVSSPVSMSKRLANLQSIGHLA